MEDSPRYSASYRLLSSLPRQLWCGDPLLLAVEISGLEKAAVGADARLPVNLSYHWYDSNGATIVHDGRRTVLPPGAGHGEPVVVEQWIESPPAPGDYRLVIELVEEGVAWFSEENVTPLEFSITYLRETAPRICMIAEACLRDDALTEYCLSQLETLRAAGYPAFVLAELVDEGLPLELRRFCMQTHRADLQRSNPDDSLAATLFVTSDLILVNYTTDYRLAHVIENDHNKIVMLDYHGRPSRDLSRQDEPNGSGTSLIEDGRLITYADHVITHGDFVRDALAETYPLPKKRIAVIPYGLKNNVRGTQSPDPALVERYGLAGKRVLLYIGPLRRDDRVIELIKALSVVRRQHPTTVLLLVSGPQDPRPDPAYAAELHSHAMELGVEQQVIFAGKLADVEPYYHLCDVFVTASADTRFYIPVIEALSYGKPVVAASNDILADVLGGAGFLSESHSSSALAADIRQLLDAAGSEKQPAEGDALAPRDAMEFGSSPFTSQPIVFVTPRYGIEVLGGAERGARSWAEQLVSTGCAVEVLTTCTADLATWTDDYAPGVEIINGVTVRRFPHDRVDLGLFHDVLIEAHKNGKVTAEAERVFMQNNLQSRALNAYLREHGHEFACAIFTPYLFGTTYWGARAVAEKAIIWPCLHDEPAARFWVFREMLEGAAGIIYNTDTERDFASTTLGVVNRCEAVVGYGFPRQPLAGDSPGFRQRHKLPAEVLLYSGRIEPSKNVPLLLDYFIRYKTEFPGPLTLALAGKSDIDLPTRPDIVLLGMLTEPQDLADAYAAATALCQPSLNESFSIVIMESWLQGRPVLVPQACAVTRHHVEKSQGGYAFDGYDDFRAALQRITCDPAHAVDLGENGRTYVLRNFSWDVLAEHMLQSVQQFIKPRSTYERLAQRGIQRALAFSRERVDAKFLRRVGQLFHSSALVPSHRRRQLDNLAQVTQPRPVEGLEVRTGSLMAQLRQRLAGQREEPRPDSTVDHQAAFNAALLETLLPLLDQSLHEQRRLRREVEALRTQIARESKK